MGYTVAARATDIAIAKAARQGIAVVGAHNTWYTGMFSWYLERITRAGLVGMAAGSAPQVVTWASSFSPSTRNCSPGGGLQPPGGRVRPECPRDPARRRQPPGPGALRPLRQTRARTRAAGTIDVQDEVITALRALVRDKGVSYACDNDE